MSNEDGNGQSAMGDESVFPQPVREITIEQARRSLNAWMSDVFRSAKAHNIEGFVFCGAITVTDDGKAYLLPGGIAHGNPEIASFCAGYAMSEAKNHALTTIHKRSAAGARHQERESDAGGGV